MNTTHEILKSFWGHDSFRVNQEEIINQVLQQKDVLALLATGGGKSICYQVPALMMDGICVVVSPLIALMEDQVNHLNQRGIQAAVLSSALSKREVDILLDNARFGKLKFLYISPERIQNRLFQERFKRMNVSFIAIDEAHCISEWGHDFRPSYRQIKTLRELQPKISVAAFTATATTETISDIQEQLGFSTPNVMNSTFYRPNIAYNIRKSENKLSDIINHIQLHEGTGIVYCRTRKEVKQIAQYLQESGIRTTFYHGGLTHSERAAKQHAWSTGKERVMVCTNAFGMGIDKSDVRFVLHFNIPETIESYYQEAGRAGRDGNSAFATLFYENEDITELDIQIDKKIPNADFLKLIYRNIGNHLQLAYGSGDEEVFDFNLLAFCDKYETELIETYNALQILQSSNLILLSDGFNETSKIQITADKSTLYNEQVRSKEVNAIVQFLLRTQMGIFERMVAIEEAKIAKHTGLSKKIIKNVLRSLDQKEILIYSEKKNGQSLQYLTPRLQENNLSIDWKLLNSRRKQIKTKWEHFKDVIFTKNCIQNAYLSYFGEHKDSDCGICNNCKKNSNQSIDLKSVIKHELNQSFSKKDRISINEFLIQIGNLDKRVVTDILRNLQEVNLVHFDDSGQYLIRP